MRRLGLVGVEGFLFGLGEGQSRSCWLHGEVLEAIEVADVVCEDG